MIRILLVEDDFSFRHLVQDILADIKDIHFVGVAENGFHAIEHLSNGLAPDVIITDLNMPIMNGLELLLKVQEQYSEIPTLVMSMHSTESHFNRVMAAGARGFVSKEDVFDLHGHILTVFRGGSAVSKRMLRYQTPDT